MRISAIKVGQKPAPTTGLTATSEYERMRRDKFRKRKEKKQAAEVEAKTTRAAAQRRTELQRMVSKIAMEKWQWCSSTHACSGLHSALREGVQKLMDSQEQSAEHTTNASANDIAT